MTATPRTRFSRYLFQAEFLDGLDYQGRIVARTGEIATYDRGGTVGAASAVDANGRIYIPGYKTPRFHHQYNAATGLFEPVGLLLEGARTNLVVQSDALTAANGWTIGAGVTVTPAYATLGTLSLSRITAANVDNVYRAVTLTGDATKAMLFVLQWDGVAGTTHHALYDVTAGTFRCYVTATWAADGTAAIVAATGTLLASMRLKNSDQGGSTYLVIARSTVCLAGNTNRIMASIAGTATSVRIGGCHVVDATSSSSVIPTAAAAVTRSADALSFALGVTAAQLASSGVSLYDDITALRVSDTCAVTTLGNTTYDGSTAVALSLISTGVRGIANAAGVLTSDRAVTLAVGDRVERLVTVTTAGVVTLTTSINSATAVVSTSSAGQAWPAAFTQPAIYLNDAASADRMGDMVRRSVRLAAGVQTMDYMRQA